eukprot:6556568-Karenia_brevis.AAC.1
MSKASCSNQYLAKNIEKPENAKHLQRPPGKGWVACSGCLWSWAISKVFSRGSAKPTFSISGFWSLQLEVLGAGYGLFCAKENMAIPKPHVAGRPLRAR